MQMSLILLYCTYGHNGIVWRLQKINIGWIPMVTYTGELAALSLLIFYLGYKGP